MVFNFLQVRNAERERLLENWTQREATSKPCRFHRKGANKDLRRQSSKMRGIQRFKTYLI